MTTESKFEFKTLLDAGVQYGHHAKFWHPKMERYLYRKHKGVHVIDIRKTQANLIAACEFVKKLSMRGGRILAVGTKFQAKQHIKRESERGGFWYINERWLGGTLTNFATIEARIRYLIEMDDRLSKNQVEFYTKREEMHLRNKVSKLHRVFGGVKTMDRMPDALYVVDVRRETIAIKEANVIGVPVIALVDSNCDPTSIQHPIPSNDDSVRSIKLITKAIADAAIEGRAEFERLELNRQALEIEMTEKVVQQAEQAVSKPKPAGDATVTAVSEQTENKTAESHSETSETVQQSAKTSAPDNDDNGPTS